MKSVTVVAVTSQRVVEHFSAIQKTLAALPFKAEALLISKPPWSIHDFNYFLLAHLPDYIHTDVALTVHWDGYAINPHLWTDEFLDYDYMGAPWPLDKLGEFTPDPKSLRVGNGGFSIRSKKWLEAARDLLSKFNQQPEDVFCCHLNTSHFLDRGCRIAPYELAQRFSFELPTDGYANPSKSFGFHGVGALKAIRMVGQ